MLKDVVKLIVLLSLAGNFAAAEAGPAVRCLRDGKVIITDLSCAAIGATLDENQPFVHPEPSKSPQVVSNPRPVFSPPVAPPIQPTKPPSPFPQFAPPPPKPVSSSGGIWKWVVMFGALFLLIKFLQKKTRADSDRRRRDANPFKVIEPDEPARAEPSWAKYATNSLDSYALDREIEKAKKKDEALPYKQAPIMSRYELEFFQRLRTALPECEIFPQVPLAAFIRIDRSKAGKRFYEKSYSWQNRIGQQRVDFLVCLRETMAVVSAVELDDPSHDNDEADARDRKKDKSLKDAGVTLVRWRVEQMPSVAEIRAQFSAEPLKQEPTVGPGVTEVVAEAAGGAVA